MDKRVIVVEKVSTHLQLSQTQCDFLAERRFAVLATINVDGSPQQSVMWYMMEGEVLVMNTLHGRRKHRNMERDSRISVSIEDEARYLTLTGTVTLNDDPKDSQRSARELAVRYDGEQEAEKAMDEVFGKQHRVTINLSIDSIDAHGF